jgi:acetyl esterase/lipase
VVCQLAAAIGGPDIVAQALLTPATDSDMTRGSYVENADGYGLTTTLVRWFYDHYADPADRNDPRIAPLRADDLSGLPPAIVVTCEFDPMRDAGDAYAEALAKAGVPTDHIRARGHTHMSLSMVDIVLSGAPVRARIAEALRHFIAAPRTTETAS